MVIDDARNFLLRTKQKYDVITSDATHPCSGDSWVLYTKEYYRLCKQHLYPGGIMAQWIPMHGLPNREFERILATFNRQFEYCILFSVPGHVIILGSTEEMSLSPEQVKRLSRPKIKQSIEEIGYFTVDELMSTFIASEQVIREKVNQLKINTDNLPYTAYSEESEKQDQRAKADNLSLIISLKKNPNNELPIAVTSKKLNRHLKETVLLYESYRLFQLGQYQKALDYAAQLVNENSDFKTAQYWYAHLLKKRAEFYVQSRTQNIEEGISLAKQGKFAEAVQYFQTFLEQVPDHYHAHFYLAGCLMELGEYEKAEFHTIKAAQLNPESQNPYKLLEIIKQKKAAKYN